MRWHGDNQLVITTNNGAESFVKQTRNDGGNVVGAVGPVLKFMLQQVENESSTSWQASALREPTRAQWQKADRFQRLFGTSKVLTVPKMGGGVWYIAMGRATGEKTFSVKIQTSQTQHFSLQKSFLDDIFLTRGDEVEKRPNVTPFKAKAAGKVMDCLSSGDPITVEQLKIFEEMRIFCESWCSCLAFAPTGFCHHRCLLGSWGTPKNPAFPKHINLSYKSLYLDAIF